MYLIATSKKVLLLETLCFAQLRPLQPFKEGICEDPLLVLSNWNALDPDPCERSGISCNGARDHVIKL